VRGEYTQLNNCLTLDVVGNDGSEHFCLSIMQIIHPVAAIDSNGRILAKRSLQSRPLTDIHSLPNEILAAIFNVGTLLSGDNRSPVQEHPFPLLVSSVNRHWRNVATNLPTLWCDVLVSYDRPREATSLWLERSGKSCLLDVTFDARGRDRVGMLACFRDVVLPHLSRWRRLVVKATSHANLYPISGLLKNASASRLQELQLDITHTMWYFHQPLLTGGTPSLRSLILRHPCPLCPVGFKNLVSLDIRPSSSRIIDICELITASPGLTDLTIRGLYAGIHGSEEEGRVIYANSLRSLAFSFAHDHPPDCCCCLFSLLSTPNLEYLEISTPSTRLCEHLRLSTPDDYHRKLPKLRVLRLQNLCFSREDADDSLHLSKIARNVTSAHFTFSDIHSMCPFSDKVLVASKNNRVPWEQLSVFTLNTPVTQDLAWVESVVLDRIKAGIPLTRVRLPRAILPEIYTGKLALAWLQGHLRVEILEKDDEGRLIEYVYDDDDDNYNDYDDYDDENSSDTEDYSSTDDEDSDSEESVSGEDELTMTAPLSGSDFLASIYL
jgi:hypothetical protein